MTIEHSQVLYRADYGSRFQGGHDAHSDHDYVHIMKDNLKDALFKNSDNAVVKTTKGNVKDDATYYSLTKFIKLLDTNGGKDFMIMLCALMKQNDIDFLQPLYKPEHFRLYAFAHAKSTFYSLVGTGNKMIHTMQKSAVANGTVNGKYYVKLYTLMAQLDHVTRLLEGVPFSHNDYLQVHIPNDVLELKREPNVRYSHVKSFLYSCEHQLDALVVQFREYYPQGFDKDAIKEKDLMVERFKSSVIDVYVSEYMKQNNLV